MVIADNLAQVVDPVYADPGAAHGPALWLATYAFAVQIYCDFSGYSDIAVGLARLLGIQLVQNFESPYRAAGPSEFWRRWHISLSTWLRDYLYISLGGNRTGRWLNLRNLMLTMLLGGLWHGAAWNFVLWGAWHGLLLVIFRPDWLKAFGIALSKIPYVGAISQGVRRLTFFHLVCLGWALFRASSLSECGTLFSTMLTPWQWSWDAWLQGVQGSGVSQWLLMWVAVMVTLVGWQMLRPVSSVTIVHWMWRRPPWERLVAVSLTLYAAAISAPEVAPPFIYFQF